MKNGRDLELRLAEPRSSFTLPLPIRLIPRLKVWDLKFYNRKTEDASQSFYRRLFLHCDHCENCFLGGMGLLAAVLPVATGKQLLRRQNALFFRDSDLRDPLLNRFQKKRRAGARLVGFFWMLQGLKTAGTLNSSLRSSVPSLSLPLPIRLIPRPFLEGVLRKPRP